MNTRIVILGGTGTLGRAIVKYLVAENPSVAILIYSRDEIKQLEMMDDFPDTKFPNLTFNLGDIRDLPRLSEVLKKEDLVVHAAAIKHVVMAEKNPEECYKTNIVGTENVIKACVAKEVSRAVLISTDKAENPIGVYGKSKLEAERLFLGNSSDSTSFGVLRLGNIVGARGSVFEVFERQRVNGVIKVTHPEATRFCISQEGAAKSVVEALENDQQELFIPEMKNFKVVDLAREIAPECEIEIVGLRPGDKLHEQLNDVDSNDVEVISPQEIKLLLK